MFEQLHPSLQHHIVNSLGWPGLRPLQEAAIAPLLAGEDALLLAPTAGGKTEAALFPLLSRVAEADWRGTSVLYLCPLRALLNNLDARVSSYAAWVGRTAGVRHGDTGQSRRRKLAVERPDVLLTTPESLESILVSSTLDPHVLLGDVRAVVIDEIHAFAGDDRGWHLLAVLERLERLAGHEIQRVGLSATVGNPEGLFEWLRAGRKRPGRVINPPADEAAPPELTLDYVGSLPNAAIVISKLGVGEKRLVFTDSRRTVEELATQLTENDVETYVSHSSLSADQRHRAESAFAEASNCVIVSTSTLELGIDVGNLDRVLQIGAPSSVASLLQRLGRTGRRPGTIRNMQLLAVDDLQLLRAAGLLLLWAEGYVEPIEAPPAPRHLAAQQALALALQERQISASAWPEWLGELALASPDEYCAVTQWLLETEHLSDDGGLLFIGNEADRKFGRRHFMELMTVFTSAPQMTVLHGRQEIGTVDPIALLTQVKGPRLLALAGRTWQVNAIDWSRRQVHAEPAEGGGKARWIGQSAPVSFAVADAMRRVLLGVDPTGVKLSQRAVAKLEDLRASMGVCVDADRTVIMRSGQDLRWWTWAGRRANATLWAALGAQDPSPVSTVDTYDEWSIPLDSALDVDSIRAALNGVRDAVNSGDGLPSVRPEDVQGLKFAELLPPGMAEATLAQRIGDGTGARARIEAPLVWRSSGPR